MVITTKSILRQQYLARRRTLAPAELAWRSEALARQLFAHFAVSSWRWLHVFLPLPAKSEPNTWLLIERLWREQLPTRLAVPQVQPGSFALHHHELTPATPLQPNRWGIPEPADPAAPALGPELFDAVLVPLLACDQHGQRLGYGGGFYDRFLAQCRPDARFIGLQLLDDEPLPALPEVLPTDVPLHACLWPGGVWNFAGAGIG